MMGNSIAEEFPGFPAGELKSIKIRALMFEIAIVAAAFRNLSGGGSRVGGAASLNKRGVLSLGERNATPQAALPAPPPPSKCARRHARPALSLQPPMSTVGNARVQRVTTANLRRFVSCLCVTAAACDSPPLPP
ncbi:unnamed protein product [Lampetra fluviatilis]